MKWLLALADAFALGLSGILAHQVAKPLRDYFGFTYPELPLDEVPGTRWLIYGTLVFSFTLWCWVGRGHFTRRKTHWDELRDIWIGLIAASLADAAIMFMTKLSFSRLSWSISWGLALLLVPVFRRLCKEFLIHIGLWQLPTLIVGAGPNAEAAIKALQSEKTLGYEIKGVVCMNHQLQTGLRELARTCALEIYPNVSCINTASNWKNWQFVVALEPEELGLQPGIVQQLTQGNAQVVIAPPLRGLPMYGTDTTYVFSHEVLLLRVRNNLARRAPRFFKRAFDLVFVALGLLVLGPLMASIAWLIKRDGGPALYAHARIGRKGVPFPCYKFRSMTSDANARLEEILDRDPNAREEWERDHKLRNDPRITRIGAFLRTTSLDEFPQLLNVLRGEMSLVGPRPIVEEELSKYAECARFYLQVRPGITGLWQVSGRNDTDYARRVALDTWYVQNWSLWYDLVILFKTIRVVLARSGAY